MQTVRRSLRGDLSRILFVTFAWLQFASTVAAGADFTSRSGRPSEAQMLGRGAGGLPGMAFVRPVLDGVLYRAGFKGGDKWIDGKFARFKADPSLNITPEQRKQICPR